MTRGLPTRLVCGATARCDGEGLRDRVVLTNALVCILSFVLAFSTMKTGLFLTPLNEPQLLDHSPAAQTDFGACILQPVGSP